jgi:hypothetical protein
MKNPCDRIPSDLVPAIRSRSAGNTLLGLFSLAILISISCIAGISQTKMNSSGNLTHDYWGTPPLNLASNPMPDANRFMTDSMKMQDNLKLFKALNAERHKEMTSDTKKLLALANRLKAETDQTANAPLSMEAVRQLELIEKLAHSVREKMKASVVN